MAFKLNKIRHPVTQEIFLFIWMKKEDFHKNFISSFNIWLKNNENKHFYKKNRLKYLKIVIQI